MGKIISLVSGKGGSGTSTFTTNLAIVLANTGSRVLVCDMNIGLRNDDIYLGMENRVLFDLSDVASGVCSLEKAIIEADICPNLFLLPAPQCKYVSNIDKSFIKSLFENLSLAFDYILVDCPVCFGGINDAIALASDKALIVLTPDSVSVRNSDAMSKRMEKLGLRNRQFVINKILQNDIDKDGGIEWISNIMEIPLVGMLSFDLDIHAGNNNGIPIALSGSSYYVKSFIEIAARLVV